MKNTLFRRVISSALAAALMATCVPTAFATDTDDTATSDLSATVIDAANRENSYSSYLERYADAQRPNETIEALGKDVTVPEGSTAEVAVTTVDGKDNVAKWSNQEGEVEFQITVPTEGLYCAEMSYEALEGTTTGVEFALLIDGVCPYTTASRITLSKVWVNESGDEISVDSKGNDIRPGQEELVTWQTKSLEDIDGLSNDPLAFYLTAGTHTITLNSEKAQVAIEYLKFYNPEALVAYDASAVDTSSVSNTSITLEGELATYKSDRTLFPTSDNTSYLTSTQNGESPTKERYNTIGASGNWNQATQAVTWEFNVDTDGWYKIGIRARQDQMRGMYSNRRLFINGEVPYAEADQIKFYYDTDWSVTTPTTDDGDTMYFYLKAGTNTLTLEAIPGEIGEIMDELDNIVYNINSYYRQIRQITGPSPDEYTNYAIDSAIPTLIDDFTTYSKQLMDMKEEIETLSGSGGTEAVTLETMAIILDKCIEKPDRIPSMMSQIKDNITAVSSWVSQYRAQPLEVDMIEVNSADVDFSSTDKSFFSSLSHGFSRFIGSFFEDYNSLSDVDSSTETMTAWIGTGRDNAKVVTNLINNDYNLTADTKIDVKLVVGGLVEATFAGKGPDIAMFVGGDQPIQLAARGALVDLSTMPDYEETIANFADDATVLYEYNGGTYALPLEQYFPMLFYRSDVLSQYGIDPETDLDTWDGLLNVLPVLQRNYMEVGLILAQMGSAGVTAVSATTEAGNTFAMLLLQQGVNYYNENQTATTFDSQEAVTAFDTWTKFYTTYSFSQTYDAFTRFRMGDMPILIQNYNFANQLSSAAPEIKGCWDFKAVPGTVQADGSVNHASNSAGTGIFIFNTAPDIEGAWDFVKWFTSTEIQTEYGNDIESVLGLMGRYATANEEALENLSWTTSEVTKIKDQLNSQVEIPVIPASYGVTRNLMNAFREVVNDASNSRDTLFWYNKDINDEITRKLEDLGINS